ncbi:universal stress protein [Actinoallomurus sp. NPDC052274]|uniref:universal stress protein n=1 Tax=Actinoallomurus sp. NPDC052274 TaxID=3155420 RepID=UPI0034491F2B
MSEIIVGTDGSDQSLRAVEWAADEAVRRALPLRIVLAEAEWMYDTPVDPRLGAVREWLLTGGRDLLARAVSTARERVPGVMVQAETAPGQVARVLLSKAGNAAMIVLGGHGMGAATGLLLGSTTLQVVTHARVPTVVVRDLEPAVRREVVVGVDGSAVGEPAVGFAFEEAALRKARLRALHVWSHPASRGPGDMQPLVYDPQIVAEEELRLVETSLATWQDKFPEVEVVFDVEHGRPARILAGASARADLLVVGTRGRGGFSGLLLGSVSHALLHRAHCPLAVVPTVR